MKSKRKLTLVLIAISTLWCYLLPAQGIDFVHDKSFQQILDLAKAQNKVIFMDCYTAWCGPCKRLAANVFPDPEVGNFFNATFINTKFDMEKEEGPSIANRYGIHAYPTLLWLDGDGNVVHKIVGGLDVQGLIQNGRKAVDPTPGILAQLKKMYAEGKREAVFLNEYVYTLNLSGEKYEEVFKEYLEKLKPEDFTNDKHARTIFDLTNNLKSPGVSYLIKNKAYYSKLLTEDAFDKKINQIAAKAVSESPKADDVALFEGAIDLLKTNKAPDHQEKVLTLSMEYYAKMNDWINYDKNATVYIKKFASANAAALNDVAWTYFLNVNDKAQLQKATKWAYDAVNTDNKYTYNLTYAYLLYKLKVFKEAEKACDYAIIKAKEENILPSAATALKDAIKKELEK